MLAKTLFLNSRGSRRAVATRLMYRFFSSSNADDDQQSPSSSSPSSATDDDPLTGWIPPNRPLIGDQAPHPHDIAPPLVQQRQQAVEDDNDEEEELRLLQLEIDRLEEEERLAKSKPTPQQPPPPAPAPVAPIPDEDTSIDWLKTRRRVMGEGLSATLPGKARHEELFDVEVKHHMLLTKAEIAHIMDKLGGQDIKVIYDDPHNRRMGGPMGMILVTAPRPFQMRNLADTLVRQMRKRKLQDVDVFGARQGPEGNEESNWMVVDCRNFIVHIMEERTRQTLDLEGMWSGKDPFFKFSELDEDAWDDYVAANPVPKDYGTPTSLDWDDQFRDLQKNRWTAPHKQVVAQPKTRSRRR